MMISFANEPGVIQHIFSQVADARRHWEKTRDSAPMELKIAELHREGYALHQIAAGARLGRNVVLKMKKKGEVQLQKQVEAEVRDRLVFED